MFNMYMRNLLHIRQMDTDDDVLVPVLVYLSDIQIGSFIDAIEPHVWNDPDVLLPMVKVCRAFRDAWRNQLLKLYKVMYLRYRDAITSKRYSYQFCASFDTPLLVRDAALYGHFEAMRSSQTRTTTSNSRTNTNSDVPI